MREVGFIYKNRARICPLFFLNLLHWIFVLLTTHRIYVAVWIRIIHVKSVGKWLRCTNNTVLHKTSYKTVLSQQRCPWTWVVIHCNVVWCFCRTNTSRSLSFLLKKKTVRTLSTSRVDVEKFVDLSCWYRRNLNVENGLTKISTFLSVVSYVPVCSFRR